MAQIVAKLVGSKAQILVLSEFRNNAKGQLIRQSLLKYGYRHQAVTAAKSDDNAVAAFSKLPCDVSLYANADQTYSANILSLHFDAFSVCGVYLPHKKKHKLLPFMEQIGKEKSYVFCGDFNTGHNGIDQKGDSFWYTDELKSLEKSGYIDAFRQMHNAKKEYSWYSHQGNGYRYDHSYVHEDLHSLVKSCDYIHEWREEKLSDHSPMMLELG